MPEINLEQQPQKASRQRPFFVSNWFWRGVQSGIWYYARCSPCRDFYDESERKYAAHKANIKQKKIIDQTPELVNEMHYGPRQTNEAWIDEIMQGPGPPKGWKKDKLATKIADRCGKLTAEIVEKSKEKTTTVQDSPKSSAESQSISTDNIPKSATQPAAAFKGEGEPISSADGVDGANTSVSAVRLGKRKASSQSLTDGDVPNTNTRPSMDRRFSSAVDNIRGTLRTTLHPEKWNWMRYDREDEIFPEFNLRMSKVWDKMTNVGYPKDDAEPTDSRRWYGRRRAETDESERQPEWVRGRNPALNDLHPPAVSQLPATPEQARWMLLPPPSADVMAGRARPGVDTRMRWPLAVAKHSQPSIDKDVPKKSIDSQDIHGSVHSGGTRTPDLSQSSVDSGSEEWESDTEAPMRRRRASVPVAGWTPVTPAPAFLKSESRRDVEYMVTAVA